MGAFAQKRVSEEPTEDERKEMLVKLGKHIEFASEYKVPKDVQDTWKGKMTDSRMDKLRKRASKLGRFESKIDEFERNGNYIGLGLLFLYTYTANLDDFKASQKSSVYNDVFLKPLEADLMKATKTERWEQPEKSKLPETIKKKIPPVLKPNVAEKKAAEDEAKAKKKAEEARLAREKAAEERKAAQKAEKEEQLEQSKLDLASKVDRAISSNYWNVFSTERDNLLRMSNDDLQKSVSKSYYLGTLFKICGENVKTFRQVLGSLEEKHLVGTKTQPSLETFIRDADSLRNMMLASVFQGESVQASVGSTSSLKSPAELRERIDEFISKSNLSVFDTTLKNYFVSAVISEDFFRLTTGEAQKMQLELNGSWKEIVKVMAAAGRELRMRNIIANLDKEQCEEVLSEVATELFSLVTPKSGNKIDERAAEAIFAYFTGFVKTEISFTNGEASVTLDEAYWDAVKASYDTVNTALQNMLDEITRNNLTEILHNARPDALLSLAGLVSLANEYNPVMNSMFKISDTLLAISRYDPTLLSSWADAVSIIALQTNEGDMERAMELINFNVRGMIGVNEQLSSEKRFLLSQIADELQHMKVDLSKGLLGRRTLLDLMTIENPTQQEIANFSAAIDHTGLGRALREGTALAGEARLMYMNTLTIMGKFRHLLVSDMFQSPVPGVTYPGEFIAQLTPERIKQELLNQVNFYMAGRGAPDAAVMMLPTPELIMGIQRAFMVGTVPLGTPDRLARLQGGGAYTAIPLSSETTGWTREIEVKYTEGGTEKTKKVTAVRDGETNNWLFTSDGTKEGVTYQLSKKTDGTWAVFADGGATETDMLVENSVKAPVEQKKLTEKRAGGGGFGLLFEGESGSLISAGGSYVSIGDDSHLISAGITGTNISLENGGLMNGTGVVQYQESPGQETLLAYSDSRWAYLSELAKKREADMIVITNYRGTTSGLGEEKETSKEGKVLAYLVRKDGTISKIGYINYPEGAEALREQTAGMIADVNEVGFTGGSVFKQGKEKEGEKPLNQEYFMALDVEQMAQSSKWFRETLKTTPAGVGISRDIESEQLEKYRRGIEKEWAAGGALTFVNKFSVGAMYSTLERRDIDEKKEYYRILGAYYDKKGKSELLLRSYAGLGLKNENVTDLFGYFEAFGKNAGGMDRFYARLAGGKVDEKLDAKTLNDALTDAETAYVRISGWVDAVYGAQFDSQTKLYLKAMYFRSSLEGSAWKSAETDEGVIFSQEDKFDPANIFFLYGLYKAKDMYLTGTYSDARLEAFRQFMWQENEQKYDSAEARVNAFNNVADTFSRHAIEQMRLRFAVGDRRFHVGAMFDAPEERAEATGLVLTENGFAFGGTAVYQILGTVENKKGEEEQARMITGTFIMGEKGDWRFEITGGYKEFVNLEEKNLDALEVVMAKFIKRLGKDVMISLAAGESGLAAAEKLKEGQAEALVHFKVRQGKREHEFFFGVNLVKGEINVKTLDEEGVESIKKTSKAYVDIPLGMTFSLDESGKNKLTIVLDAAAYPFLASGGALIAYSSPSFGAGAAVQYNVSPGLRPDMRYPTSVKNFLQSQTVSKEELYANLLIRAFAKAYFYETQ
jgi:hypothetical protein